MIDLIDVNDVLGNHAMLGIVPPWPQWLRDHPKLVHKLKQALYRGEGNKILTTVRLARLNGLGDPERVDGLFNYLQTNQGGFYSARSLRSQLSREGKLVCVNGSGAVEKHVDLTICRRFKGQGMRWTRKGANRLSKILTRAQTALKGARQGCLKEINAEFLVSPRGISAIRSKLAAGERRKIRKKGSTMNQAAAYVFSGCLLP